MKKVKFAASLLAVSVAASALLTGCATVPDATNNTTTAAPANTAAPTTDAQGNTEAPADTTAPEAATPQYAAGTVLRMATGYNSKDTGLSMLLLQTELPTRQVT